MAVLKLTCLLVVAAWTACAIEAISLDPGFELNRGVSRASLPYVSRGPGGAVFGGCDGFRIEVGRQTARVQLMESNARCTSSGLEERASRINYLVGDETAWVTGIRVFGAAIFRDVYPSVDAVYRSTATGFTYQLIFRPGADRAEIRFRLELPPGVDKGRSDVFGATTSQQGSHLVHVTEVTSGTGEVKLALDEFDRRRPLTLTTSFSYSTFLGGSGQSAATAIAVDSANNIYATGWTESLDFPEAGGGLIGGGGGVDAWVAKLNPAGQLVYLTYIGGLGDDRSFGIAVDGTGQAVVGGWTYSPNFPVINAAQSTPGGGKDGFIAKLSYSGNSLVFSTFVGGSNSDSVNGVAVDRNGNVYAAGETNSINFPLLSPYQSVSGGGIDAFALAYSPIGVRLYATYIGGHSNDRATAIAVDAYGDAFLTGSTYSTDFPIANAFQQRLAGGQDVFVAKLSPAGNQLLYSTYLGGSKGDASMPEQGNAIALDNTGAAYVTGTTSSTDFPTSNAYQSALSGSQDAFLLKLGPTGGTILYGTYFGGSSVDQAFGVVVDSLASAYVSGYTSSTDLPVVNTTQATNSGSFDGFAAGFSATGNALIFSTYVGGSNADSATAIALDVAGDVFLAGQTASSNFPVSLSLQPFESACAYIAKLPKPSGITSAVSVSPASGTGSSQAFTFEFADTAGYSDLNAAVIVINSTLDGSNACFLLYERSAATLSLYNDGTQSWPSIVAGSSQSVQNSQCSIANFAVTLSGNTAILSVAVTFATQFAGPKSIFASVQNQAGAQCPFLVLGTWSVPGGIPSADSVTPSSGSGVAQTFTFQFADTAGYRDLNAAVVVINSVLSGNNACFLLYQRAAATLALYNDSTQSWPAIAAGTNQTVQNSQCSITNLVVSGNANVVTLSVWVTFAAGFAGPKTIFASVQTQSGTQSPFALLGTWTVSGGVPSPVSVAPASGRGSAQIFTFQFADTAGYADLNAAVIVINSALNGNNSCFLLYQRSASTLSLYNDATQSWPSITAGFSQSVQNAQCSVANLTVTLSGNLATISVFVTFASSFSGAKSIFATVQNQVGAQSPFLTLGTWSVP